MMRHVSGTKPLMWKQLEIEAPLSVKLKQQIPEPPNSPKKAKGSTVAEQWANLQASD